MQSKSKFAVKAVAAIGIFLSLYVMLGKFFQPVWPAWNNWYNYFTMYGFYEEPEDTIETIFLGSSVMADAIVPMSLYRDYGLCTYNLATERQPMLASYYWLQEAYVLHPNTLKSVVLDVSQLRTDVNGKADYQKAIDPMRFSEIKWQAVQAYTEQLGGSFRDTVSNFIPFISYHDRWKELKTDDFNKQNLDPVNGTRGYHFTDIQHGDSKLLSEVELSALAPNPEVKKCELEEESVFYLNKIIEFCEEKEIQLVLIKTPAYNWGWSSTYHNAVAPLVDELGFEFLDFNYAPLVQEIEYVAAFDSMDNVHMNIFGAEKLTEWIGRYLLEECDGTDVRNLPKYAYMEEEYEEHYETVSHLAELQTAGDIAQYLKVVLSEDNSVFIAAVDEASRSLTDEQRACFKELGLDELSQLAYRDSYVAVIDGSTITEKRKDGEDTSDKKPITYSGTLIDDEKFTVVSGGFNHGVTASIKIDGTDYTDKSSARGLRVVVYSNEYDKVIDTTTFDTFKASNRNCYSLDSVGIVMQNMELQKITDITEYLAAVMEEDNTVFITVGDEASYSLTDAQRGYFAGIGLEELSQLAMRDSYLAVIEGGKVVVEQRKDGADKSNANPISYTDTAHEVTVELISGGFDHGCIASVELDGVQHAKNRRGINIVVYSNEYDQVIDTTVFDTCGSSTRKPYEFDVSAVNNSSPIEEQIKYFLVKQEEKSAAVN